MNRAVESSASVAAIRRARSTLAVGVESSTTGRLVRTIGAILDAATRSSRTRAILATVAVWTRHAWLYRWLTAEPEPDVVVIDLRETWTVGPIVEILDRVIEAIAPAQSGSTLLSGARALEERIRQSPIRTLSLVVVAAVATNVALQALLGSLTRIELFLAAVVFAVALVGTRVRTTWEEFVDSAVGQWLIALLEPPEPPEER